ncbi:MAG: LLM class F420-dependent oxidoreductase, partial [Rhodospirillaceae bacterium]|nr:LLM class F420-dependent oxidoreductase [Rhodospirillaceae bacterium]
MAVKLGLTLGTGGNKATIDMDYVHEAEKLGYDTVWTAEAWGSDALTPA